MILVSTQATAVSTVEPVASAISFQPLSNQLKSLTHGNGLVSTASYDLDSRLTQLQLKNGALLVQGQAYSYADGMNLTGITNQVTAGDSATLAYSAANRLTSATGPWGTKTHYYDGVGNRITDNTTLGAATTTRTQYYSPTSNRLDNIWQNGALLQYYSHDGAGNMTSLIRTGESFAYTYNKRNRLASVTRNSAPWGAYVYNALEQLVSRTSNAPSVPAGTFHYIYDLDGHLIAEADAATGATLREYLWVSEGTMQRSGGPLPFTNANDNTSGSGNDTLAEAMGLADNDNTPPDLPLAVIDGVNTATPVTSYIHTDHLGRPTRMTNAAKATVWQATWTPWGEPQSISGSVTQNLRFPGQYFQIGEAEKKRIQWIVFPPNGLAYNWHRHYDPATGRYTQPDPLRFVDGPSIYAYARSSPFVVTDRDGRCPMCAAFVIGAAIGLLEEYLWNGNCATLRDYVAAGLGGGVGSLIGGNAWRVLKWSCKLKWTNFSHSFPDKWFRPFTPSGRANPHFKPWLPQWLNGPLNGSVVSPWRHLAHDAGIPKNFRPKGSEPWPSWARHLDRIPDWMKGAMFGGGLGAGAFDGSATR